MTGENEPPPKVLVSFFASHSYVRDSLCIHYLHRTLLLNGITRCIEWYYPVELYYPEISCTMDTAHPLNGITHFTK